MAAEELTIKGLTGVDMTLRVAGPGTRSYAFVIDWHVRVLLALAWILAGLLLRLELPGAFGGGPTSMPFLLTFFAPALLVYLLYHPVLEVALRGRTPGKRMAGVRIVTREGATPGAGALLMRNLFRLIDSLPAFYVLGLSCCMLTAQRVRIGDLAAGTVLVLDEQGARRSLGRVGALLQHSSLDPNALALVQDLIDRWTELDEERRTLLARALLARIAPRSDGAELAALDEAALRARLRALLAGE